MQSTQETLSIYGQASLEPHLNRMSPRLEPREARSVPGRQAWDPRPMPVLERNWGLDEDKRREK